MLADGQHVGAHMFQDAHGLEVTAASAAAVQAFDHALMGYLRYRADMPQRMARCSRRTRSSAWRIA